MPPWKMRILPSDSVTFRGQRTPFPCPFGSDIVEVASSPGRSRALRQYQGLCFRLTNQLGQSLSAQPLGESTGQECQGCVIGYISICRYLLKFGLSQEGPEPSQA